MHNTEHLLRPIYAEQAYFRFPIQWNERGAAPKMVEIENKSVKHKIPSLGVDLDEPDVNIVAFSVVDTV